MKRKLILLMFSGLLAGSLTVSAQDSTTPAEASADTATNTTPADATAATETAAATETVAAAPAADAAPAVEAASDTVITTSRDELITTNSAIIPLIVMDDVPLTDAIKNLARQANLNYMLDPRIAFGQPGPNGQVTPVPTVSIRWENITAEQALQALLNNYGLQLTHDPKTQIARVTVKDPAAPDPLVTKIIQLHFSGASNILPSLQGAIIDKRSRVVADVRTSQIVIVATEREIAAIEQMVERLDLPTKQVLIEARLLETSLNPNTIKGIDWSGTLQAQNFSVGNNLRELPPNESVNNVLVGPGLPKLLLDTASGFNPGTAFLDADGVNAVLSFINKNSEAKVISTPRTVTLDNETAVLSVTRASPIINVTASTPNTSGGSTITYTNLGVILTVTPRISANNYINLHVMPEVSRIFDTIVRNVGGAPFQADIYDVRKMETRVMIPSAHTLVLGGLVQDDTRISNTKVPLLGDIPLLGNAFRTDSKSRQKNNLLVFITPTIVEDGDFRPTKTDFMQSPMAESSDEEWSAWDSGKPYDWSKLRRN